MRYKASWGLALFWGLQPSKMTSFPILDGGKNGGVLNSKTKKSSLLQSGLKTHSTPSNRFLCQKQEKEKLQVIFSSDTQIHERQKRAPLTSQQFSRNILGLIWWLSTWPLEVGAQGRQSIQLHQLHRCCIGLGGSIPFICYKVASYVHHTSAPGCLYWPFSTNTKKTVSYCIAIFWTSLQNSTLSCSSIVGSSCIHGALACLYRGFGREGRTYQCVRIWVFSLMKCAF